MLFEYDLMINAKMNQLTGSNQYPWFDGDAEVQVKELEAFVRSGRGFLAIHAGNSYFWNETEEYCRFNGCAFVKHPPRCEVTVRPVGEHPITTGVGEFRVRDEHYEVDHLAKDAQLLLESVSEAGGTQVAGYVRQIGAGRLCALLPGHALSVFQNEMYKRLIRQAVLWTAGKI